jgi:molybdate transport system ATP-binding protein
MLELALDARRGSFHLHVACKLTAPWTVVFGPSGAGKTTLLRLLAGLDRPSRGELVKGSVTFCGRSLTDTARSLWLPPGRRKISFVTQQTALFPYLTTAQNVAYGLRHLDRATRSARVAEMLELVGAHELAPRLPSNISGGQAQRIALARALAIKPSLLLLDEPFSALDGAASDALLARLHVWLRENSVQTIAATHDVSDALATNAEVLLLREGRLAALGPAKDVLAAERNRLIDRLNSV